MGSFNTLLLTFLELTFVFVSLLVLHSQRKNIGETPFYIAMGVLLVFGQLLCGADLEIRNFGNAPFQIAPVVIFMPFLAAMLLIYISDGALAAQRLIIGSLVVMGLFFYLGDLTRLQARWVTYSVSGNLPLEALDILLERSRRAMLAIVSAQVLDFFMLPIIYTRLRNTKFNLFTSCLGALGIGCLIDSMIYLLLTGGRISGFWYEFSALAGAKLIAAAWLSGLLTLYISKVSSLSETFHQGSLEIVFAFLGSYGRSKMLEANLQEWEGRYRMILENASEMIVVVDAQGKILDANPAAVRMLESNHLVGREFDRCLDDASAEAFRQKLVEQMQNRDKTSALFEVSAVLSGDGESKHLLNLALSITPLEIGGLKAFIVMGRDITEELRLAAEEQRLNEELTHSQRLEALGQLAGGVAHDFNNNIHAILGHADLMALSGDLPEKKQRHLNKIIEIAEQSGKLTSQLLGFARKGKYQESEFDLRILIRRSADIFMPGSTDIELDVETADYPLLVRGDQIQLQQVFLNLLINARDALRMIEDRERILTVKLFDLDPTAVPEVLQSSLAQYENLEKWVLLSIADNGCGMTPETLKRVFEPFFTTKPIGKGTGMGLAMAYGTITNHRGCIAVDSQVGSGTIFYIALPLSSYE